MSDERKQTEWMVFCAGCRKQWAVSYQHPGKSICAGCESILEAHFTRPASPQGAQEGEREQEARQRWAGWKHPSSAPDGLPTDPRPCSHKKETVVVPREPTEAMVIAGARCNVSLKMGNSGMAERIGVMVVKNVWQAMLTAAESK